MGRHEEVEKSANGRGRETTETNSSERLHEAQQNLRSCPLRKWLVESSSGLLDTKAQCSLR